MVTNKNKMEKEEIIKEVGKPILRFILWIRVICLLVVLSSPFIFIWYSFTFALKVGLSGLILVFIFNLIYKASKEGIIQAVNEEYKKPNDPSKTKSKFQEKLEAMQKAQKEKLKKNV